MLPKKKSRYVMRDIKSFFGNNGSTSRANPPSVQGEEHQDQEVQDQSPVQDDHMEIEDADAENQENVTENQENSSQGEEEENLEPSGQEEELIEEWNIGHIEEERRKVHLRDRSKWTITSVACHATELAAPTGIATTVWVFRSLSIPSSGLPDLRWRGALPLLDPTAMALACSFCSSLFLIFCNSRFLPIIYLNLNVTTHMHANCWFSSLIEFQSPKGLHICL